MLHVYSKRVYDDKIKPLVEAEAKRLKLLGTNEDLVVTIKRLTTECWEAEPEELQKEIRQYVETQHTDALADYEDYLAEQAGEGDIFQ